MNRRPRYIVLPLLASLAFCAPLHAGSKKPVSRDYIGTYLNEGKTTVELNMISADGHEGTEITLDPGRMAAALRSYLRWLPHFNSEQPAPRRPSLILFSLGEWR